MFERPSGNGQQGHRICYLLFVDTVTQCNQVSRPACKLMFLFIWYVLSE